MAFELGVVLVVLFVGRGLLDYVVGLFLALLDDWLWIGRNDYWGWLFVLISLYYGLVKNILSLFILDFRFFFLGASAGGNKVLLSAVSSGTASSRCDFLVLVDFFFFLLIPIRPSASKFVVLDDFFLVFFSSGSTRAPSSCNLLLIGLQNFQKSFWYLGVF
jgi:hypothetical protein